MPYQYMVGGVLLVVTHLGMKRTGTYKRQEITYGDVSYGDVSYSDEMYGDVAYRDVSSLFQ
jgi:hypothetical protein